MDEANGLWCAAFVYHCVILAGFKIPVRPKESSCSLAGCVAWEEWAQADNRIECHSGNDDVFEPAAGDIVLFDRVFNNTDHDHIGIVLEDYDDYIITAEGNVENVSRILERKKDSHIRAYIRIPDNFFVLRQLLVGEGETFRLYFRELVRVLYSRRVLGLII